MRSTRPRVSVVIPAYNAARYLGAAITSALTQTYPDVEVVVVNDGSDDETLAIARAYGDRITLVDQENRGLASARNAGVLGSSGELIALCDADDLLLPSHVERCVASWQEAGPARSWVGTASWLLEDELHVRPRPFFMGSPGPEAQLDAILAGNFVPIFCVFPRSMFDEVGGFTDGLRSCEDWDFWLRAIVVGWRVTLRVERTAIYRITPGSLSSDSTRMSASHKAVLRNLLAEHRSALSETQVALIEERLDAESQLVVSRRAHAALRARDIAAARRLFAESARLNPFDIGTQSRARLLRVIRSDAVVAGLVRARNR